MTKKKSKEKIRKNRNLLKMDSNRTKKTRRRRIKNGCSGSEVKQSSEIQQNQKIRNWRQKKQQPSQATSRIRTTASL